jgi:protein kinase-like protein
VSVGQVGPYLLERELGRGGMGVVYVARHPQIPRPLALKRLLVAMAEPKERARFLREAELLARVRHPNVVTVHDLATAPNGDPYLVTDLVDGEPLDERLKRGPLEPGEAARLVRALAGGVEAVHAQGVLHRDLKPANVIVTPTGVPVLLDFGLARELHGERLTQTGEVMGTPAFMAPEQAEGDPNLIDRRCDVYGLGAVLYAALTAAHPFQGSLIQILPKILEQDPPWPRSLRPEVPPALDAIVRLAMHKVPGGRYATVADLEADLGRWLEGEEPVALARAPAPTGRTGGALVGAFVALVVIGFLGALAYRVQRPALVSEVEQSQVTALPYAPLPPGQLLTETLEGGTHNADGATFAFFLGGEPRWVAAVNRIERVLRAWRVDVTPRQASPPLEIPESEGLWASWAAPHPSQPHLAVLLRSGPERLPDQAWLAVFSHGEDGWNELWRQELDLKEPDRRRFIPGHGYLRLRYAPSGDRLAVTLPYGAIQLRGAEAGELQASLRVPNHVQENRLLWPTSTGGLTFLDEDRIAIALHSPANLTAAKPGELKPKSGQLAIHIWSDLGLAEPTHTIRTPSQAATTLSSFGDEIAVGFQQHRVARVAQDAELCSPQDDLPTKDEPRTYRNVTGAPKASIGHPPRWLLYTRDGSLLVAAGGDVSSRLAQDAEGKDNPGDGGEIRWWKRAPDGALVPGDKWVDEGAITPHKRFIHTIHLDPSERYVVVGRNDGYVQLIRAPWRP